MDKDTKFVGLDVHRASISVAIADPGRGEVRSFGTIPNNSDAVVKLIKQLGPTVRLSFWYGAGPCGYGLHRRLTRLGAACMVAAPSLTPRKPGERIKTDRRARRSERPCHIELHRRSLGGAADRDLRGSLRRQ